MKQLQLLNKLQPVKKAAIKWTKANSSNILVGIGVGGYITAIVMGCKATPAAQKKLTEAENKKGSELTKWEKVKTAAPVYGPTAAVAVGATACVVGSKVLDYRKHAALAAAYEISQNNLREIQKSIVETVGEKKAQQIKDNAAKNRGIENPPKEEGIIYTGLGDSLCYDAISGRYFKTNYERIYQAELEINKRLLSEPYLPLNDFYELIGLPYIELGNQLGFVGFSFGDGLEIEYSSQLTDDKVPCLVINYGVSPVYE